MTELEKKVHELELKLNKANNEIKLLEKDLKLIETKVDNMSKEDFGKQFESEFFNRYDKNLKIYLIISFIVYIIGFILLGYYYYFT